jgi:hypothetical protein
MNHRIKKTTTTKPAVNQGQSTSTRHPTPGSAGRFDLELAIDFYLRAVSPAGLTPTQLGCLVKKGRPDSVWQKIDAVLAAMQDVGWVTPTDAFGPVQWCLRVEAHEASTPDTFLQALREETARRCLPKFPLARAALN